MDAILNQRWQNGLAPFNGDCLSTDDLISVADLGSLLTVIVTVLQMEYDSQEIFMFNDWHQHDGFITDRRSTQWSSLLAVAQNQESLIASRQGDYRVHRSFYPSDLSFLLRYDIPDDDCGDKTSCSGTFDLSANSVFIAKVMEWVPEKMWPHLLVEPSKDYFDKTYAC